MSDPKLLKRTERGGIYAVGEHQPQSQHVSAFAFAIRVAISHAESASDGGQFDHDIHVQCPLAYARLAADALEAAAEALRAIEVPTPKREDMQ
jgi:hypothetical protein